MPHKSKQMATMATRVVTIYRSCCRCCCCNSYCYCRGPCCCLGCCCCAFSICFRGTAAWLVNKIRRKMRTSDAYEESNSQRAKRKCHFVAHCHQRPHPVPPRLLCWLSRRGHLAGVDKRVKPRCLPSLSPPSILLPFQSFSHFVSVYKLCHVCLRLADCLLGRFDCLFVCLSLGSCACVCFNIKHF